MSGGPNAEIVPCLHCFEKAVRTSEGIEDDWYECTVCGKTFGIDWSYDGPPDAPRWPPTDEDRATFLKMKRLLDRGN
jgi:hypothetical protein